MKGRSEPIALGLLSIVVAFNVSACASTPATTFGKSFCPNDQTPITETPTQTCDTRDVWLAANEALWSRLGSSMPRADTMIVVSALSVHHTRIEWSTVAVRDPAGTWRVEGIGEERSGLVRLEPTPLHQARRTLSRTEAARLDTLLADPGLWREPGFHGMPRNAGPGVWFSEMDLVTPSRRAHVAWIGGLRGRGGQVVDILEQP